MYTGTKVPIPFGRRGLFGSLGRVPIDGLVRANGLTFANRRLEKEAGTKKQNTVALAGQIVAVFDWWPNVSTQRTIAATQGGGLYLDDGVAWSFATTLLAEKTLSVTTRPPFFVTAGNETPGANRLLFLYTGVSPVYVGVGDFRTIATLAAAKTPADWTGARQPSCGVVHESRNWAFLQHTAYYTPAGDHQNFQGGGSLAIYPGEGEEIVAGISLRKMLVLFKRPRGIYIVDTSAIDPTQWRVDPQSQAVGAPGPWAVAPIPNDAVFVEAEGGSFHLLSATGITRDAASSDISSQSIGQWIREHIDPNRLAFAQIGWYSDKKQVYAIMPGFGHIISQVSTFDSGAFDPGAFASGVTAPAPQYRIVIDLNQPDLGPVFSYSDRDDAASLMLRRESGVQRPFIGTDAGFVSRLDLAGVYDRDGVGYLGEWQTDYNDLGEADPDWKGKRKNFDFLELWMEGVGAYDLSVDVYVDGVKKTASPLLFRMTPAGVGLGTFKLGTDTLAEAHVVSVVRRLRWAGYRIAFRGFNNVANQTFKIVEGYVYARRAS